jgi:ABC-type phosphate transport system substrate-binding protein
MSSLTARRLACACALSAAFSTALVVPGIASATPGGEQCSGETIEGKGASLQKLAQIEIWNPGFNKGANPLACSGTQGSKGEPKAIYTSTGSGAFLRSWGQEPKEASEVNFGPKNSFGGTDEPPNETQKSEIESHSTGTKGKLLQTIPVLQAAVTISVHLPKGCKAEGGPAPGRLGLNEKNLEKFFAGEITAWSKLLNKAKLVKSGSEPCESTAPIKRVVRKDGSGTTSLFKKYLWLENKKEVEPGKTWKNLAESANNTTWPKEKEAGHEVLRGEGNGGVAAEVAANASTIGYVNLADARHDGHFTPAPGTGGAGTATFWAEVENGKITVEGKKVATFADPSTNGDEGAKAQSNCAETNYTNGSKKFPPESTALPWNEVTSATKEPNYVICGFTYDLGLEHMSTFTSGSKEAPTEKAERTQYDYYNFVLADGVGGGQTLIGEETDYLGLPSAIKKIAREGIERLSF